MISFYIKLFLGKRDPNNPKHRGAFANLAGITGIVFNIFLFIGKLAVGLLSASVAIIADAFNNISDAGSSLVTLIGFRLASKPVDKEHPLGHGRLEYVTGFIVDMLIILVGFELFTSSIEKIANPTLPSVGNISLILLGAAILVKVWLYFFYKKISKIIQSNALKASALDSLTDCIATGLVLISAIVGRVFSLPIDGYAGILVAAFILYSGAKAAKETIDLLLGSPPEPEFIQDIHEFCKNYPSVVGIHDVMVHDYGPGRKIVSFHAEVPSTADINLAHEEIDQLERDMHEKFGCIVTVHLDPITVNDPVVEEFKTLASECAKELGQDCSIHDFRMTKGETQINLIFDLVLPAGYPLKNAQAEKLLEEKIKEKDGRCNCVIRAEHPFI